MLKDQVKKVPPLGGGIELCGSSSCLEGLRSLLNTEGILALPMFLLSYGPLIQMWSASFAQWCRVLLSLSITVKSLSSAFQCFVERWFLMALVVWFLWSETLSFKDLLVSSMYSAVQFHSYISNINQMVAQVCWWCPQCHLERSSQPTSRASQFPRSTHQILHRTPRNRWTPLPRYPDQTHS